MKSTKPAAKVGKKPAQKAKAKPVRGKIDPKKRGAFVPHKADIDAFASGELTSVAKRLNRIIDAAFKHRKRFLASEALYQERMKAIYDKHCGGERGATIRDVANERRVLFQLRRTERGNAFAYEAQKLINSFISELLMTKGVTDDQRIMAEFLAGVIQEVRGQIINTKRLSDFRKKKFHDERLCQAQKLLGDAFDVVESGIFPRCEVYSEEQQKWLPY